MANISDEVRLEIAQAYECGDTYEQMTHRFGVHSNTIYKIAKELGIQKRGRSHLKGSVLSRQPSSFEVIERVKRDLDKARNKRVQAEQLLAQAKQQEEKLVAEIKAHSSAIRQQLEALLSDVEQPKNNQHAVVRSAPSSDILGAGAAEHQHRSEGQQNRRQNERDEKRTLALPLR